MCFWISTSVIVLLVPLSTTFPWDSANVEYDRTHDGPYLDLATEAEGAKLFKRQLSAAVPWLGVLITSQNWKLNKSAAMTGIVLIAPRIALGVAKDVAKIDEKHIKYTTRAVFMYEDHQTWNCTVDSYVVHPEYNQKVNTLALIALDGTLTLKWQHITWPPSIAYYSRSSLFGVRYTDRYKILEQEVFGIRLQNKTACKKFYVKEKLDYKHLWPTHYLCAVEKKNRGTCVYDSGTVLATNRSGIWTLVGLSTFGPGCNLPARFIEFFPYVRWVIDMIVPDLRRRGELTEIYGYGGARRGGGENEKPVYIKNEARDDPKILFEILHNSVIVMKKVSKDLLLKTVNIYGSCESKHARLVYLDEASFVAPNKFKGNVGYYTIQIYDMLQKKVDCIQVILNATKVSSPKVVFSEGAKYYDLSHILHKGQASYKKVPVYLQDDTRIIHNISAVTVAMKFEFDGAGSLRVKFYSNGGDVSTPPPPGGGPFGFPDDGISFGPPPDNPPYCSPSDNNPPCRPAPGDKPNQPEEVVTPSPPPRRTPRRYMTTLRGKLRLRKHQEQSLF